MLPQCDNLYSIGTILLRTNEGSKGVLYIGYNLYLFDSKSKCTYTTMKIKPLENYPVLNFDYQSEALH